MSTKRPILLRFISETLTIYGLGMPVLYYFAMAARGFDKTYPNGEPVWITFALAALLLQIYTISGFALQFGRRWGRTLYVGYGLISIVSNLVLAFLRAGPAVEHLPGSLVILIFSFLLFRPSISRYLVEVEANKKDEGQNTRDILREGPSRFQHLFYMLHPSVWSRKGREEYIKADSEFCAKVTAGRPEIASKEEYQRILEGKKNGSLTIFINTAEFRWFLTGRGNAEKLTTATQLPIQAELRFLQVLSWLDITLWLIATVIALIGFGWVGLLLGAGCFFVWLCVRVWVSWGRQVNALFPELGIFLISLAVAFWLNDWELWRRVFIATVGFMVFNAKFVYFYTARLVFNYIDLSYKFFNLFYLPSSLSIAPLIWTSELSTQSENATPRIVQCTQCQQQLRVRVLEDKVTVRCPACRHEFEVLRI